jgi:UDP-glucose 4-epimerase
MKVLVTGGAGFIGSNLVDGLLARGLEVVVLDSFLRGNKLPQETVGRIQLIEGDVRDEETVLDAASGCRWIFHLAAYLGVDVVADNPVDTMETEALGMRNIARAAILTGCEKIVYASTSGVYGKAAIEKAVDEEFEVSPSSSYSIAKRYNEIYLRSLWQQKKLQSFSLRYFNVYGPRQDNRMVIPRFVESALAGKPLTVFGKGGQSRDFTYVDDVVEATIRVAEMGKGCEILNVARGTDTSVLELARKIVAVSGSTAPINCIEPPPGRYDFEVERRCGSSAKMRQMIGIGLPTSLEEGLIPTIAALRAGPQPLPKENAA